MKPLLLAPLLLASLHALPAADKAAAPAAQFVSVAALEPEPPNARRVVAGENVCAWPNLTLLRDGTVAAVLFNQPTHGQAEGDVECWVSRDGLQWEKRS